MPVVIDLQLLKTIEYIAGLIVLDTILGIALAVTKGNFKFSEIARWLQTAVLPYLGGLLVLAYLSGLNPAMKDLFMAATATAVVKYLADIVGKLSSFGIAKDANPPLPPSGNTQ
ncbi:MAG: hypothetical protein ACP5LD_10605 [Desulfomonilaceae bacterium]